MRQGSSALLRREPYFLQSPSGAYDGGDDLVMRTNLLNLDDLPGNETSQYLLRILIIVSLTVIAHLLVWLVRYISEWMVTRSAAKRMPVGFVTQQPKFITLTRLLSSALTFIIYSIALGFILHVFGVNSKKFLTTYLATASVLGLAVGFGSQGLVQDVVTGLTLILSDTLDVGDMIEVSGQVGRVERIGLRFTELTNFLNQQVFIPNRTIGNIARFPRGGVHAYVDIQVPASADRRNVIESVNRIVKGTWTQFSGIILSEPEISDFETAEPGGWMFLRVQFRIWPGQGAVLETAFRQRVVQEMKAMEPTYADWMVTVIYRAILKSHGKANFTI
jgi:moderate conductance mechanosensitive channel